MAEAVTVIEIPVEVVDNTQAGAASATENVSKLEKAMQKAQSSIAKMQKMSKIEFIMYAVDKASNVMNSVWNLGKGLAGKVFSFTLKAVDLVTAPVRGIMNFLSNPVMAAASIAGITLGVADTINTYKDFEQEMANIQAITGATTDEMDKMESGIRKIALDSNKSVIEIAANAKMLAESGGDINLMMTQLTHGVNLATATQTDMATTLDFLGSAMKTFGIEAEDTQSVADSLAYTTRMANVELSQLSESYVNVGGSAASAGLSIHDINAALITLSNAGMKGGEAGTTLNTMFDNLTSPTDAAAKSIKALGLSLYDTEGQSRDMFDIISDLEKSLKDMNDESRNNYLSNIFDDVALQGWHALMTDGIDTIREQSAELSDLSGDFRGLGTAAGMAETQLDTMGGLFSLLQGAVDEFKLSIGEKAAPYIRQFAGWLTDKIPSATEAAVGAFEWVEDKAKGLGRTIKEFTSTDEWDNADFFGKIGIAWDKLIAEPFSEWWDGTGKAKVAGIAQDIGSGIGSSIKWGISALFGLDINGVIDDGLSIGKSFADGFTKGIEGIDWNQVVKGLSDAVMWALETAFSNPVTGTLAASFIGSKVLGGVSSGYQAFQGAKGILGTVLGVPSASDGSPVSLNMLGNAGLFKLSGVGTKLGSGATMTSGLAAAGAAGIAGGIIGGVTLISAGTDLYKGFTSDNQEEAAVYKESGALKAGSVAAGATVGAVVGSVVPVIGTAIGALVGAGIGGVAGWLQGDSVKKKYEQSMLEADEAKKSAWITREQAKYSSDELKNAVQLLADESITAYEFMELRQATITDSIRKHFGNVKLSMSEIQSLAEKITFGDMKKGLSDFSEATAKADGALAGLKQSAKGLERQHWKMTIGLDYDVEEYKTGMESYIVQAKEYIESRHYEMTLSTQFFFGENYDLSNLNNIIAGYKSQIDNIFELSLEEPDAGKISEYYRQVKEITNKLAQEEQQANFDFLGSMMGLKDLDYSHFELLQSKFETAALNAKEGILSTQSAAAFEIRLEFTEGLIDEETYERKRNELAQRAADELSGVDQRISSSLIEGISSAFDMSAEELTSGMQESIQYGFNPAIWTKQQAHDFLGLDSLEDGAAAQIAQMVNRLAALVPDLWNVPEDLGLRNEWDNKPITDPAEIGELEQRFFSLFIPEEPTMTINPSIANPTSLNFEESNDVFKSYANGIKSNAEGGIFGAYANGGILDKRGLQSISSYTDSRGVMSAPHIGLVGEDGAEDIIPLSSNRRQRGLSLWEKAGEMLGVFRRSDDDSTAPHANGGIFGVKPYAEGGIIGTPVASTSPQIGGADGNSMVAPIIMHNNINPTVEVRVDGNADESKIIQIIRNAVPELADDIAGAIADALRQQYANTPLSAWE